MLTEMMTVYQIVLVVCDFLYLLLQSIFLSLLELWRVVYPRKMKSLAGEVVLVTGTGHGIGRELAIQLARIGAKVVCCDVNDENNRKTVAKIKKETGIAWAFRMDVTNKHDVKSVCDTVKDTIGDVTMLINNAGIMPCKPFMKHNADEIELIYKTNVLSHFWLIREFLPSFMAEGRGHIVALSSMTGLFGTANLVPYGSSKFAIRGLMEGLTEELRYANRYPKIKLSCVYPYTINTGLAQKPRIRFPSINPVISAERCASIIIDDIRRDEEVIVVPRRDYYLYKFKSWFPRRVQKAFIDFMDTGVDAHD